MASSGVATERINEGNAVTTFPFVRGAILNTMLGKYADPVNAVAILMRQYSTPLLLVLVLLAALPPAGAGEAPVQIGWLSQAIRRTLPLSYLDQPPRDEGIQGASSVLPTTTRPDISPGNLSRSSRRSYPRMAMSLRAFANSPQRVFGSS